MLADLFFYSRNPQVQSHDVVKRNKMWKIKTFTIIFVIIILICNQMQLFQFFVLFSSMAVLGKNKKNFQWNVLPNKNKQALVIR